MDYFNFASWVNICLFSYICSRWGFLVCFFAGSFLPPLCEVSNLRERVIDWRRDAEKVFDHRSLDTFFSLFFFLFSH